MYAYKKNRADEALLDWFGKCGVNLWGAENLLPGMRKRGHPPVRATTIC